MMLVRIQLGSINYKVMIIYNNNLYNNIIKNNTKNINEYKIFLYLFKHYSFNHLYRYFKILEKKLKYPFLRQNILYILQIT